MARCTVVVQVHSAGSVMAMSKACTPRSRSEIGDWSCRTRLNPPHPMEELRVRATRKFVRLASVQVGFTVPLSVFWVKLQPWTK